MASAEVQIDSSGMSMPLRQQPGPQVASGEDRVVGQHQEPPAVVLQGAMKSAPPGSPAARGPGRRPCRSASSGRAFRRSWGPLGVRPIPRRAALRVMIGRTWRSDRTVRLQDRGRGAQQMTGSDSCQMTMSTGCRIRPWWCWSGRPAPGSRAGPRRVTGRPRSSPPTRCGRWWAAVRPIWTPARRLRPAGADRRRADRPRADHGRRHSGPRSRPAAVLPAAGPGRRAAGGAGDHGHPGRALPAAQPGPGPAGACPGAHRAAAPGPADWSAEAADEGWDQVRSSTVGHGDVRRARRVGAFDGSSASSLGPPVGRARGDPAGVAVPLGRGPDRLARSSWPWPPTRPGSPGSP